MPRTVMILNNPTLKVATTEAGLTSGQSVECQVTSAAVTASPSFVTIPATGCAGATQSPGLTGFQLDLAWLQDWQAPPPGGLSRFAFENDARPVWFELTPDAADATTKVTGEAYAVSGAIGGTFGDGSAATATATWPLVNKPDVLMPVAVTTEATEGETTEAA